MILYVLISGLSLVGYITEFYDSYLNPVIPAIINTSRKLY